MRISDCSSDVCSSDLVGSGGREHALAWKLAQSPRLGKLWAAPGNAGIANHGECVALNVADHGAVIAFCRKNEIDLVVIGPEQPLVEGLANALAQDRKSTRLNSSH